MLPLLSLQDAGAGEAVRAGVDGVNVHASSAFLLMNTGQRVERTGQWRAVIQGGCLARLCLFETMIRLDCLTITLFKV